MKNFLAVLILIIFLLVARQSFSQNEPSDNLLVEPLSSELPIFDDKMLLEGYTQKYRLLPKDIIVEMLKDDTVNSYRLAATVRTFKERFSPDIVSREKIILEKILLRRLSRDNSAFVQVEIMDTLCRMDRYRYFESMVPALIQKMEHYNQTVHEMAYDAINHLIRSGNNRSREARIVFETNRKILFLSRKRLANVTQPGQKLKQKLEILRWSIKVLGTQELKKLPPEVLNLL